MAMDSVRLEESILPPALRSPTDVDRIMDCANGVSCLLRPHLVERFLRCLPIVGEEGVLDMVFHRTQGSSLDGISRTGFVVPDGQHVRVANGNRYGPGVYATWFDSYRAHQRFGANLLLCLGFRGEVRENNLEVNDGICSRVVNKSQLIVYRHGCQLLPIVILDTDDSAAEEAWHLAERISLELFEMSPLVRGQWVAKVVVSQPGVLGVRCPVQPSPEQIEQQKRVMRQWTAAEKYLARPERRLQVEMKAVQELIGEESIREVQERTFPNSLAQWEAMLRTRDGEISIGLAFPMCYPKWPPHMFSLRHSPLARQSVPVVSDNGGINVLILMGMSRWEPSVQVKDLLEKLCVILSTGTWGTSRSINPKLSLASFCGDGVDICAAPSGRLPHLRPGEPSRMQDRVSIHRVAVQAVRDFNSGAASCGGGISTVLESMLAKISESSASSSLGRSSAPTRHPREVQRTGYEGQGASLVGEFQAILDESAAMGAELGGAPNFPDGKVSLIGKVTRREFKTYTGLEHLQLTVLGFARLSEISERVLSLNNGAPFFANPGTMLLEEECGLTMHADRHGAIEAVKTGPCLMLTVFGMAQKAGKAKDFFMEAFNRHHDPCLEGRFLLIQEFGQGLLASGFNAEELQLQDSAHPQDHEASDEGGSKRKHQTGFREAALRLQRWWRGCLEARRALFEGLVVELMELRAGSAEEVQRAWRGYTGRRRDRAGAASSS